ncbi:ATP-dependent DNA helicase [Frankliniella fusca]|uniref:ATP-dependent DNA helicase n=1 Tax=Frankliniella fusca TaxID=407009 RepID=A0AAE1GY14_9NEOP|nr:ATP-dependent DNA helicase [Frankliniella fusca]
MLFTAWRTEPSLLDPTLPSQFSQLLETIQSNRNNYCKYDNTFDNIDVDLIEEDEENDEESIVAPQFKILDLNETPSDFQLEIPHTEKIASPTEASRFPLPKLLPESEFLSLIKCLNEKQRKYLINLTSIVKTNPSEPFYHFISGGAGVGKSLLINSIKQVLERFWIHQPNNKPDDIHILPIAPTETKYIVSHNIAVPDGISNGSPCILKKVIYEQLCEKGNREQIPIRAYVQFEKKKKQQVTRNQLPLLPSNAQTIHCSQSCTYKNILVFITKNLSRKLLYTAFSRVESLQGLHISGIYKKLIRATIENDPSLREMIRMRSDAQLQFSLTFPEEVKNDGNIIALFHNVRSLNLHFPNVCSDRTLLACDIIMLAETWPQPTDRYEIDNFTIVYRTDCASTKRKAFGTLIYVKSALLPHINILFQNESISGTNQSTVVALTVCSKTVIMVYKSPKCQWLVLQQQLQQAINTSLQNNVHEIAIMGDFNIKYQVSDPNFKNLNEFMIQNNCLMVLDPTKVSTDHNSLIDLCFSTNPQTNSFIFESATSDHKPIWIELSNP